MGSGFQVRRGLVCPEVRLAWRGVPTEWGSLGRVVLSVLTMNSPIQFKQQRKSRPTLSECYWTDTNANGVNQTTAPAYPSDKTPGEWTP